MNRLLVFVTFFFYLNSFSQEKEKSFEVKNDIIIFYLNNFGDVTTKTKSSYYRKAKINITDYIYDGLVEDYFSNGQLAFQQSFENGEINGQSLQYYDNGKLNITGQFKNSLKEGLWNYYYDNGSIEKIIQYKSGRPSLQEFRKRNGKTVFTNGNGKYRGNIIIGYKSNSSYRISGTIKNGQTHGWWEWPDGKELFEDGVLIKGLTSWSEYNSNPAISLTGFNLHEEVSIFKFMAFPKSKLLGYKFSEILSYNNSNNLDEDFKTELIKHISEINKKTSSKNYWCFIQFNINKNNITNDIEVYTNNKLISTNLKTFILNLKKFKTPNPKNEPTECLVYLSFFVEDGEIIMPKYSFYSDINVMDLVPKY